MHLITLIWARVLISFVSLRFIFHPAWAPSSISLPPIKESTSNLPPSPGPCFQPRGNYKALTSLIMRYWGARHAPTLLKIFVRLRTITSSFWGSHLTLFLCRLGVFILRPVSWCTHFCSAARVQRASLFS